MYGLLIKVRSMYPKYNISTELRPEGERVLDAPMVSIDLNQFIDQIRDEKTWKKNDRNAITVFKTPGMRIVLISLHEDAIMAKHKAEGIISVHVLDGRINFITDDRTEELTNGQMVTLHKGISHSIAALKKSVFLLTIAG